MRNEEQNFVCRLCLNSYECILEDIKAVTTEMLGILGLDLDLNVSETPVICKLCSENLQQCFDLKTRYLHTEHFIYSFRNSTNNGKQDLREIYLKKYGNDNLAISTCHSICRLCMEIVEAGCYMSLDEETKDIAPIKTILRKCFSELDLNIVKNPVVCTSCNASLHSYFSFMKKYLDLEGKTKKCNETEGINNKPPGESILMLPFAAENISNYKNGCTDIGTCKNCNEEKSEELCIKHEVNEYKEVDYVAVEELDSTLQFSTRNTSCCKYDHIDINIVKKCHENEQNDETDLKCEYFMEKESYKFNIKHEEVNIKTEDGDITRFQDNVVIIKDASGVATYCCKICKFRTNYRQILKKHSVLHTNVSEAVLHQCEDCGYITKYKLCLDKHILIHKNGSEVRMYQCDVCGYRTRRKYALKRHTLIHKSASEVTTYQCYACTFKTRHKEAIKRHVLIHKNLSKVTTYSCKMCTYKTNGKDTFKKHMLIHRNASKVTHSCTMCMYKTKEKCNLKKHMLIHKDASELTMYPCTICAYKSKQKGNLKRHVLIHKDASKITVYSCGICTYKTKEKCNLKQHILVHKNSSEITSYSCGVCTYETKRRSNLKRHMLSHKNTAEVIAYSCGICTYKTKLKEGLKRHMLIHKNASDVTMFSCVICTYKTKLKCNFKRHMLVHTNAS